MYTYMCTYMYTYIKGLLKKHLKIPLLQQKISDSLIFMIIFE